MNRKQRATAVESVLIPPKVFSCTHISPILDATRNEGVEVLIENEKYARANCCLSLPKLQRRFWNASKELYLERHEIDRSYLDPKSAFLHCEACEC